MSRRKTADALPIRFAPNPSGRGESWRSWRWLDAGEIMKVGDYYQRLTDGAFRNLAEDSPMLIGGRVGKTMTEHFLRPAPPGKGNFANPAQHSAAGKLGGAKVSKDRKHMAKIGRKGGLTVAQNKEHMAEIGRRGGKAGNKEVTT